MSIVGSYIVPHPPLIIPEIGHGTEKIILETIKSYQKISEEVADLKPDTLIISSPHAPFNYKSFYISSGPTLTGNFGAFHASAISFHEEVDQELVEMIEEIAKKENISLSKGENIPLDHGTMVPLYFINQKKTPFKIVVIGLTNQPYITHYQLGKAIQEAANKLNKRIVYIASGDLSHKLKEDGPYGFIEEGPIYDKRLIEDCKEGAFDQLFNYSKELLEKASPCGHLSF